jgi:hypothetical protein
MSLLNEILNAVGGDALGKLGGSQGLDERQTRSALESLLPALSRGMKRNTQSPAGLESALAALRDGGHSRYLERPEQLGEEATRRDGNGILGHLLGSKEVSREVARRASERTGIGTDALKKLLPVAATLFMGAMSRKSGQQAEPTGARASGNPLASLLDSDDDGSIADDLLGLAKKFF